MAKIKSSKKVLIASLLVGVLVLGAVVSLILVLAAPQQNVKTNVKVSYVVDGVGASVSAKYHIVNPTSGVVASSVNLSNDEEGESLDFSVSDLTTTKELNPSDETIILSSTNSMIVYEYEFTNNTVSPFMVSLIDEPNKEDINEVNNMTVSYRSTASRLTNFAGGFADSESKSQLVLNKDQTIYVYIAVEVSELNNSANYNGEIEWLISKVEEEAFSTLTLDTAGGDGGQTEIKYIANETVQLPHLTSLPKSSGTTEFMGYKNTAGKYVYDASGNSLTSESATENITYTAEWIEAYQVSVTGELTGLTAEAQTLTTLNIPESVTTINSGVLNNTTTSATTINIPASVTTIGESAFEGNTVVENINIAEAPETAAYADDKLTSIGAKAFKGCSNLKELIIPEGVTSIGVGALQNMTNLEYLVLPSTVISLEYGEYDFDFDLWYWGEIEEVYLMHDGGSLEGCKKLKKLECNADLIVGSWWYDVSLDSGLDFLYGYGCCIVTGYSYEYRLSNYAPTTLQEIVINGGTSIKEYAFYNANNIKSVKIECDTIKNIDNCAFVDCDNLEELIINENLVNIYNELDSQSFECWAPTEAFEGCPKTLFNEYNGGYYLGTKTNPYHLFYKAKVDVDDIKLHENTKVLATQCGTHIDEINYDYSVLDFIISYSSTITSITIPASVTSIGIDAFRGCTNLTSVIFKNAAGWQVGGDYVDVTDFQTNASNFVDGSWGSFASGELTCQTTVKGDFIIAGETIIGLSEQGKTKTEIFVSYDGYSISAGAFEGYTHITSIEFEQLNAYVIMYLNNSGEFIGTSDEILSSDGQENAQLLTSGEGVNYYIAAVA